MVYLLICIFIVVLMVVCSIAMFAIYGSIQLAFAAWLLYTACVMGCALVVTVLNKG